MTNLQFNIYLMDVEASKRLNPSWRMGQTYFNVLANHQPELAKHYRGSMHDPFYNDNLVADFLYDLHLRFVNDPVTAEELDDIYYTQND